jgi:hypothetical protein
MAEKKQPCMPYANVRSSERMRPFGRSKHGWEDNIKIDLKEIAWEGVR